MSVPPVFDGMTEVRGALTADLQGHLRERTAGASGWTEQSTANAAAALAALSAAGAAARLSRLELLVVKGPQSGTVTAVRPDSFLVAIVDGAKGTRQVEKAAQAWAAPAQPSAASTAAAAPASARKDALSRPPSRATPPPIPAVQPRSAGAPAAPPARLAAGAAPPGPHAPAAAHAPDPWAGLRRALTRGQLGEAASLQRELGDAPATGGARPGSEPLSADERERAMQRLLEGVGGVMAGDGVGGARTLRELAQPSQQNLSIRWLALCWSARAAMRSGSTPAARAFVKDALAIARDLDVEARAVSQWIAAEVLAYDSDPARALAWVHEARSRFERIQDRWGIGQTWLAEARILAGSRREEEALEAARQAWAANPDWDEPPVFLARRAVMRGNLEEAEGIVEAVSSPAAERVRRLIAAVRQKEVSEADAAEYLREHDAAPSANAIRALERIAHTSPRFVQAREALAWMLLKLGKYSDAGTIFRGLLAQALSPGDRASVMLGLGCIANARGAGGDQPAPGIRAAVAAAEPPTAPAGAAAAPLPQLSTSSLLVRSAQNGNGGPGAVFSGQLGDFALPDLLEFLRSAKRTGVLVCSAPRGMGALRFREGWITEAASQATPPVGELLVAARKISALALRTVSAAKGDQPDHVVGERLVRDGLADAASVKEAFERQIELTVRELVQWTDGEFAFNREGESDPAPPEIAVALDPQAVLLGVFTKLDEQSRDAAAAR